MSDTNSEHVIDTTVKKSKKRLRKNKIQEDPPEEEQQSEKEDQEDILRLQADIAKLEAELVEPSETSNKGGKKRKAKISDKLPMPNSIQSKTSKKKKGIEMTEEQIDQSAIILVKQMLEAVTDDNQSNKDGKPALKKLLMLDDVCRELRKLSIQERFMDNGGISVLGRWLEPLPDGTFPNINVVKEVLVTINALQINPDNLQDSTNLGRIVKVYANGQSGIQAVQALAKTIVDKWNRMVFKINTSYGDNQQTGTADDDQYYRQHKQRLQKYEVEVDEPPMQKETQEITRGRAGIIMPARNAFDFVERPEFNLPDDGGRTAMSKKQGSHAQLKKVMDSLKRQNRSQAAGNKSAVKC